MSGKFWSRLIVALATSVVATTAAVASDYPERPITMVVTFSAGGSSDVLARAVANALSQGLGKTVVVENRPGAGGHIGAEIVSRARPDGYTILFGTNGTLGIGPAIYKNLRYNPAKDLVPVGILHKLPLMLIVQNNIPANNLQEFIAYAKAHPGKLTFASAGVGTASHLSGELLKEAAGIEILHVPYKGGGGAAPDLLAGNVSMMIETIPTALPFVANKQLRALGVTTRERSPTAPEVPTFAEQGLKDFDVTAWTGLFVPAGTPPEIIARLNAETLKIAQSPDYVAQIKKMGTDVATSSPEEFRKFVDTDVARWTEVVKRSGAQID